MRRDGKNATNPAPRRRRIFPSPGNQNWGRVTTEVWNRLFEDEIFGRAAQLAYYWLFSLFPLLIFLTALLAFLPIRDELSQWIGMLSRVLPPDAFTLLNDAFQQIAKHPRSDLLSFGILATIWAASTGMEAIITSLNIAFDAPLTRPWWKERSLAIALTLGLAAFIIAALAMIFFGGHIGQQLSAAFDFSRTFELVWAVAQWPIAIILVFLGIDLVYYFAPNLRRGELGRRWEMFSPGAIFAVVFWLLISLGFRLYVSQFNAFNATYGALGGVMALMLWLYLTGLAILVGGEINSVLRTAPSSCRDAEN
jgi:membrane protein